MLKKMLGQDSKTVVAAKSRIEDRDAVAKELDEVKPTRVLLAAGLTGRPNVDWCETHQEETIRVNVTGTLSLADLCSQRGLHVTIFATGCIYHYDDDHPVGGKGFTEEDKPNFDGSFYSKTKAMVEELLKSYSNVCVLRVRMPISDDLSERNFVTKIARYDKVVDIPNSMTVLSGMLPLSLAMSAAEVKGIYNFTNRGVISHNEILELYKEIVDPNFTYANFTVEEQAKVIKAPRSNNYLDTTKLEACAKQLGMEVPEVREAVVAALTLSRKALQDAGQYPAGLPKKFGPGNAGLNGPATNGSK